MPRRVAPPRKARPEGHGRQLLIDTAARIMADEGVRDFQLAKRKAAQRLNLPETRNWPGNIEIERAFEAHLTLFHADLSKTRARLRQAAVEAMQFLADFDPRLVGAVLSGWVTKFSVVQLHTVANTPEDFDLFLAQHSIPNEQTEKRLRFGGDHTEAVPAFEFVAGDVPIEVLVFNPTLRRAAPLSPIDGRPMARATLKELEGLLAGSGAPR
ncbi:MAG: hypothetical protein ACYDDA_07235 [Acidiferrobacteraceae bacterium]